jgi:hypothetical protein
MDPYFDEDWDGGDYEGNTQYDPIKDYVEAKRRVSTSPRPTAVETAAIWEHVAHSIAEISTEIIEQLEDELRKEKHTRDDFDPPSHVTAACTNKFACCHAQDQGKIHSHTLHVEVFVAPFKSQYLSFPYALRY